MVSQKADSRRSAVPKGKAQLQDDSIMGTNNSSIVSKRSVERLYYPNEPHFFRYFVKKPQRRSPLINRGYWLRMKAVDQVVRQFLEQNSSPKQKVVINLGCGYDPLPWQSMVRYPGHCKGVKFIDIDYKDLMLKKRNTVSSTKELTAFLSNLELSDENVLLRSDEYIQIGCDLRDLKLLNQTLASVVDIENSTILLTAEVSITYMDVESADALIQWAGNLPDARFCLLEQILPAGIEHPFGRTMMAHFMKLNTPLRAVQKYPTTTAQEERFKRLGWSEAVARKLWRLWSDPKFLSSQERISLDAVEPFDEWEEFALFGCHYVLLVADTLDISPTDAFSKVDTPIFDDGSSYQDANFSVELETAYSENPKAQGHRRFGAVMPLKMSTPVHESVGLFGGMGLNTRVNTHDVYSTDPTGGMRSDAQASAITPSSRMCHTITDLGEAGALLVGGRTSPDHSLSDCWLYHKWLQIWERVDDLPSPQYRHRAVYLGNGRVLIAPGKTDSRTISRDFWIWSRTLGWVKCIQDSTGEKLLQSYGATFIINEHSIGNSTGSCGLLAGGMSEDSVVLEDVWEWDLRHESSLEPVIRFGVMKDPKSRMAIARFGASVAYHDHETWIVGGISKNELLSESEAIALIPTPQSEVIRVPLIRTSDSTPQPLFIGSSIISTGDSVLAMGGSAVCFSFGTFWNKGCYTFRLVKYGTEERRLQSSLEAPKVWSFAFTVATTKILAADLQPFASTPPMSDVPRVKIGSVADFEQILRLAKPVIVEGLDLGPCTEVWTSEYLKEKVGNTREVTVHEAQTQHMDFQLKNFVYSTKSFGDFIDQASNGGKLYLRSLSAERPADLPADISRDFASISDDFRLPPELALVRETAHSCPLRISGPVIIWLHYDVMANVLCQIKGSKRLLLFPPSDVQHLGFEAGASSSSINVFNSQDPIPSNTHPHEALLNPGDVLFLPPLWLHTASPSSGMSVAVNVFFRNLQSGYAAGKDVYGNRDLQAYEKGRQDVAKIIKSFESLPTDIRGFYLQRLAKEFEEKAC